MKQINYKVLFYILLGVVVIIHAWSFFKPKVEYRSEIRRLQKDFDEDLYKLTAILLAQHLLYDRPTNFFIAYDTVRGENLLFLSSDVEFAPERKYSVVFSQKDIDLLTAWYDTNTAPHIHGEFETTQWFFLNQLGNVFYQLSTFPEKFKHVKYQ